MLLDYSFEGAGDLYLSVNDRQASRRPLKGCVCVCMGCVDPVVPCSSSSVGLSVRTSRKTSVSGPIPP